MSPSPSAWLLYLPATVRSPCASRTATPPLVTYTGDERSLSTHGTESDTLHRGVKEYVSPRSMEF